jgi:Mrp family chromosome partitioning ATPase
MSTAERPQQRFTVVSPFGQHQVDLPVDEPVSGFLPDLLAMVGMHPSQARAGSAGWQLDDANGNTLPADGTLAGYGIGPGAVIQLRDVRPPSWPGGMPGSPADAGGGGNSKDKSLLSRHVPRLPAPSGPPDDSLTPLQRAEAALPQKVGQLSRVIAVSQAFLQGAKGQAAALAAEQDPARMPTKPPPGRHRLLPADLTVATPPSRTDCARARWRDLDHLGQLDSRITEPRLRHCATIAVVSPKGGVGKTTITALLGTLFSLLRRDPIVAVDTNPDFGSLGRVLTPDQTWYVDDLARLVAEDDELSLTALDSHLGRAIHGLLVVPAPTDPARMAALDEDAYRRVIVRLKDFFSLSVLG